MLAVRLQALDSFRRDGTIFFRGNDPWYHFREISYLVEHFPSTIPFDVMTNYPQGTSAEQFGTLYDQLVAGVILLTSFGDPSQNHIGMVMLLSTPVFAAAAVIPVYLIATRFTGRKPALVGATVFALLPGTVLSFSLVGFPDHSAAEVLFQTLAVAAFVYALTVAERDPLVWELVVDRDFDALRRPALYATLAGIAAAMYMWAWPPGVLLVGFTGIFFAIKLTSDVYHGQSPEPIAFVGAISMTVAGLLLLLPLQNLDFGSSTDFSLQQPVLSLGVAAGCVFLAALARQWETRDLDDSLFPVAVGGILLALAVVFRDFSQSLLSSVISRIGFGTGATARTVGEVQPFLSRGDPFDVIYSEYRLALFTALIALLIILAKPLVTSDETRDTGYVVAALGTVGLLFLGTPLFESIAGLLGTSWQLLGLFTVTGLVVGATLLHRYDAPDLCLVVWAGFILSAAFTQQRFNYYLAAVVAVFNAIFIAQIAGYIDIRSVGVSARESVESLDGWQVIAIVTVAFVVIAPFFSPVAALQSGDIDKSVAALERGGNNGPGAVTIWDESLEWMEAETPTPGTLGGADNPIDPQGTYERPADGDYDYEAGAYGVQSWWDYGHWITARSERIPNANPFQQGATDAANFLLAPNETAAADALDQRMDEGDETRYVMLDWKLAEPSSRKYNAPTVFNNNVSGREMVDFAYPAVDTGQGTQYRQPIRLMTQRHYESLRVRLYSFHGSATNPRPIVVNTELQTAQTQSGQQRQIQSFNQEDGVRTFGTLNQAQDFVENNSEATLGGIGDNPRERVDALEQYRLVHSTQTLGSASGRYQRSIRRTAQLTGLSVNQLFRTSPSWVKTFEKVPGATVEGTGAPDGAEVRATVRMENPAVGQTFSYTQYATADENGNFEMTVPYSTTGYEDYGPNNGYTNVSVRATGEYQFQAVDGGEVYLGRTAVDESKVVGDDETPVDVELDQEQLEQISQQPTQTTG
jgi:dolichyl-diphosphooligosaccharide--protein glycosyltransferase